MNCNFNLQGRESQKKHPPREISLDKDRIVQPTPHWESLKYIFSSMGLPIIEKKTPEEYVSHGILLIVKGEGLFLQMSYTYEYRSILLGAYDGAQLYYYLSLITKRERELLNEHPFVQWKSVHPHSNMPGELYRKMLSLQRYLPLILGLIPVRENRIMKYLRDADPAIRDVLDNSDDMSLLLTIPKGRPEKGETSKQTACRECQEETGIQVKTEDLQLLYVERYTGTDGNIYTTYIHAAILSEYPSITLGTGFKGYLWISCEENIQYFKQTKLLSTFLYQLNDKRLLEQRRKLRNSMPSEAPKEQAHGDASRPASNVSRSKKVAKLPNSSWSIYSKGKSGKVPIILQRGSSSSSPL